MNHLSAVYSSVHQFFVSPTSAYIHQPISLHQDQFIFRILWSQFSALRSGIMRFFFGAFGLSRNLLGQCIEWGHSRSFHTFRSPRFTEALNVMSFMWLRKRHSVSNRETPPLHLTRLSVEWCFCLFILLYPSVHLFLYTYILPSTYLTLYLYVYVRMYARLSIHPSIHPTTYLPTYPPTYLSIRHPVHMD
jgi:hypothetical protein